MKPPNCLTFLLPLAMACDSGRVDINRYDEGAPPPLLPACTVTEGDGRLDLVNGCADGVCTTDTYAGWVAVLGEGNCTSSYSGAKCDWGGLVAYFDDDDDDGVGGKEHYRPNPKDCGDPGFCP